MKRFFLILSIFSVIVCEAQVKIRLFTDLKPPTIIFSVNAGEYLLNCFDGDTVHLVAGDKVIIARFNGKLAVKTRNKPGFASDSVSFRGLTGADYFSVKPEGPTPVRYYSGDLACISDLNTVLMINSCDEEQYIAGVVRSEGGGGKHIEYFKTQAVLARTYMYRYMNKHSADGYNLCDGTHCQAYSGLCTDRIINIATRDTRGVVVLGNDSIPIISAFHSNCGGETASSEDVWLTPVPYLKRVKDTYCAGTGNAYWQKTYSGEEWLNMLDRLSHKDPKINLEEVKFFQSSRASNYKAGSIDIPLTLIRSELNLKSTYFSVIPENGNVILKGRGYGHGVGLCQEGAMNMASKGFNYREIIDFYYSGVMISDISKAKREPAVK